MSLLNRAFYRFIIITLCLLHIATYAQHLIKPGATKNMDNTTKLIRLLKQEAPRMASIFKGLSSSDVSNIDFSINNPNLKGLHNDPDKMNQYVERLTQKAKTKATLGGYLEKRMIYEDKPGYSNEDLRSQRNIHLGVDIWIKDNTAVHAPLPGTIFSFQDNKGEGNYGPTIILKHQIAGLTFYSLYGHLSRDSLKGKKPGQQIGRGEEFATIGSPPTNGNWPHHLHLQLIMEMGGWVGDYPGVAAEKDLPFYKQNCPNPLLLLPNLVT